MDYKLICGDVLVELKKLDSESIDLVFTSPPYNLGNFEKRGRYGGSKSDKMVYDNHDDNMPEKDYMEWQHAIINELYRLIKPTGAIFYNHKTRIKNGIFDDRRHLIPMKIRQEIIWDRCGMVNFAGSFYAPNTERIFIIAKEKWHPNKEYLKLGEVWRIPPELNTEHPCPFPLKLAETVVLSASKKDDTILDCFNGSGTTGVAALTYGRSYIGIDISQNYIDYSKDRFSKVAVIKESLF